MKSSFGLRLVKSPQQIKRRWKVEMADWKLFTDHLANCPSDNIIHPSDTHTSNRSLTNKILEAARIAIPQTSGSKSYNLTVHGFNTECREACKERRKAKRNLFRSPTPANLEIYNQKANHAKWKIKNARQKSWQEFVGSIDCHTTNKEMWQKIKSIRGGSRSSPVYPVGDPGSSLLTKANLFLNNFGRENTLTGDLDEIVKHSVQNYFATTEHFEPKPLTSHELNESLSILKNKAPGPDDIPNSLLKKLPNNFREKLLYLFNVSWHSGCVPTDWKTGDIRPILKPERSPSSIGSYRPICMLSTIGKLMERILQRRLEYFLESQFKLGEAQYGFRQEKSTMDALLIVNNTIRHAIDNGKYCIVVHLDIQGAYDNVWHDGLLFKMIELGVDRQTMHWINSYLSDRKIRVTIGGCSSAELAVQCGVPQGAVLSPILFNIMLNDFPYDEKVKLISYADDITLTVVADELRNAEEYMQTYLDSLFEWFTNWHFTLNPTKCSSQLFTRRRNYIFNNFHLNGAAIPYEQKKKASRGNF